MENATPRSWKVFVGGESHIVDVADNRGIVARCHSSFIGAPSLKEGKANAELIVRAVNNFDQMRELIEDVYNYLDSRPSLTDEEQSLFNQIEETLLKSGWKQ